MAENDIEKLAVDTIRTLSMDAVEQANSGHPGTPMALAPVAYSLFAQVMNHDPADPDWINRDRFVLSAGHASMLIYSILHLTGYDLSLEDLKDFRQLGVQDAGPPRGGAHRGRRDDDRARSARASRRRSAWRSPSGCSTPASATSSTTSPT